MSTQIKAERKFPLRGMQDVSEASEMPLGNHAESPVERLGFYRPQRGVVGHSTTLVYPLGSLESQALARDA
jgi:hypothetical protein